jgi:HAD superfamily phosphoserine phosphatase-like hydrolase
MLSPRRWDASVREGLEAMIRAHGRESAGWSRDRRPLAVFDWDNTCIAGDIGEAALMALDARDGGDRMGTYERMVETDGKRIAYAWCAFALEGMTPREVREFTLDVIDGWTADGRIRLRPELVDLVAAMQASGWETWAITASAEPLVQAFAQRYGIPADQVAGMRLAIDDGRYAARLAGPNTFREGKVEAIDRYIGRRPVFAAGDTETDLEMLWCARHALLIDRHEPMMRAAAAEGGWWLQELP